VCQDGMFNRARCSWAMMRHLGDDEKFHDEEKL